MWGRQVSNLRPLACKTDHPERHAHLRLRRSAASVTHTVGRCLNRASWGRRAGVGCTRDVSRRVHLMTTQRLNITLDGEHASKLARLAARVHVNEGTLARSLLSSAIDGP